MDASGHPLRDDPTLMPGAVVTVNASGFATNAAVSITMHSTPTYLGTRVADADGVVSYVFTVPHGVAAGAHSLVFAGPAKSVTFHFVVGSTGGGGTSPGNLSATGDDIMTPTLFGILSILLGAGMLYVVRWRFIYRGRHS